MLTGVLEISTDKSADSFGVEFKVFSAIGLASLRMIDMLLLVKITVLTLRP